MRNGGQEVRSQGPGRKQTTPEAGPEVQLSASSEKERGQEVSRPAFLDGAGKGGGWPVEKFFAASDLSSYQ